MANELSIPRIATQFGVISFRIGVFEVRAEIFNSEVANKFVFLRGCKEKLYLTDEQI